MTSSPPATSRLSSILALAALLVLVATSPAVAQPARFPCGTTSPNQRICDLLSHPTARRTEGVSIPVDSECVGVKGLGYFCGFQGARCTSDSQCDFGLCSGDAEEPGECIGGLGDLCEGPDGPEDALCMGNLQCQKREDGVLGKARCGGSGAACSFQGAYEPSSRPNHQACMSGYCSPSSLTCVSRPPTIPGRPQGAFYRADNSAQSQQRLERLPLPPVQPASARQRLSLPAGASCPIGFSICPMQPRRGSGAGGGFEFACFDTQTSITHCGGCPNIGAGFWGADGEEKEGVDCTKMEGVASAACVDARCRVFSCSPNYEFDRENGACVRKRYW
ncbi:hypothetical protein JCM8097_006653 [Rhodosporidiobolus ruineniae]